MDLNQILLAKRRSVSELVQFIKTRTDGVPNYTMLLGSGASITSGIRSGQRLVEEWRRDIFRQFFPEEEYTPDRAKQLLAKDYSHWYSVQREYSSLFEKKFDLPRQRRMFVENEVAGKFPSIGYAYLIRLIEKGFLNTIFTTNFDDLLNEAFHQFSDYRPIVCAHDSSISSVTVTSKRPKIIKVHGDYLFDDIKSTVRETESLEENTKKKFIEFGKDHGLIVVGYGGGDRSVMDVLNYLLKQEEYLKHGIYWCVREDANYSDELIKLLWKDRVYWVPVAGFDELSATIHSECLGDGLPISTALVSEKPRHIIRKFCSSNHLLLSTNTVIQRDLVRLKQELEKDALFDSMRPFTNVDEERSSLDMISDADRIAIMAIRKSIMDHDFITAAEAVEKALSQPTHEEFKTSLLYEKLDLDTAKGDLGSALQTTEMLIAADENNVDLYLTRSRFEAKLELRRASIEKALLIDPYHHRAHRRSAELAKIELSQLNGTSAQAKVKQVLEAYESSILRYPAVGNRSWSELFEFLESNVLDDSEARDKACEIRDHLDRMDKHCEVALDIAVREANLSKRSDAEKNAVLDRVRDAIGRQSKRDVRRFELMYMQALRQFDRIPELLEKLHEADDDSKWANYWDYKYFRSLVYAQIEGKLNEAIEILRSCEKQREEVRSVKRIVEYLCLASRPEEATRILRDSRSIPHSDNRKMCAWIASAEGQHARAAHIYGEMYSATSEPWILANWVHELLVADRPVEADKIARDFLKLNSFSMQYPVIIINLELAVLRQAKTMEKARLQRGPRQFRCTRRCEGGCVLLA